MKPEPGSDRNSARQRAGVDFPWSGWENACGAIEPSSTPISHRGMQEKGRKWSNGLAGARENWWLERPDRGLSVIEIACALTSMKTRRHMRSTQRSDKTK